MDEINGLPHEQLSPDAEAVITARSARARIAILQALADLDECASAARIAEVINSSGLDLQARSVRFHLLQLDRQGLTRSQSKHEGRVITDLGRQELLRASAARKIGFVASKMDDLAYRLTLDAASGAGSVAANEAVIDARDLTRSFYYMKPVFGAGLSIGDRIAVRTASTSIGGCSLPKGKVALSTICGVSIKGALLRAGIAVTSRFGGLVEMENGRPTRFVELTEYHSISTNPHTLFIRANLTNVNACAASGSGIICASFGEFPAAALDKVRELTAALKAKNLGGVLALGLPGRPLLDIPVVDGRAAMITLGGMNPLAALHEAGVPVELNSLAGLEDLSSFVPFNDIAPMGKRSAFID